ncbi:MAG: (Fe-S)-binding protein [Bdellovibrio bacteriovorus]
MPEHPPPDPPIPSPAELLELADQCVKCGLCLPHCPTYGKLANEGDSPRGRIALIQGWAMGRLALSPRLTGHLDRCLTCRACELACPSLVSFGRLMDGFKAARVRRLPRWRRSVRLARLEALSRPAVTLRLARAARWYRDSWLARWVEAVGAERRPGIGTLARLAGAIPKSTKALDPSSPESPDLELFVGCTGQLAQGSAMLAARALCEGLGLRVRIAAEPGCCGALFRHNGFPEEAQARRAAWTQGPRDIPLVGLASACVGELREGAEGRQILELCDFLDRMTPLDQLPLAPLPGKVLVHEPCSQRNLLKDTGAVYRLLGLIPGLEVRPLPGNALCCGAAGTYMLDQPAMADSLLSDKVAALSGQPPRYLVTTNPGCALHLAAGIRAAGLAIEVCHPVELIWESAKDRGPSAKG